MEDKPTVFLVDDDPDMRDALRYLVESIGVKVEEYENAKAFLRAYDGRRPTCVVLDMRLPGISGLEVLDTLLDRFNELPVIMFTGHGDVPSAVRALKSGAVDFLEKPFNGQAMLEKIQLCLETDTERLAACRYREEVTARFSHLTPREQEVLDLIVSGMTNNNIASRLTISVKTVRIHRAHVLEKTQTSSLQELLKLVSIISP